MASEWNEVPLSALAELSGGFAFKSGDYAPSGRFVLRTLNISNDGNINRDDAVYLPEDLCPQYSRFELKPADTLFVMVGATLGKIGFVREKDLPALLNQNMWLIRAKPEKVNPRFLHYAFRHWVKESLGWASGSARDFVRRDDYRNLKIPVPSLLEQKAIAHILGTLDDKIELNRRMNQTLEAMAQALFKSWFVDFDPVRAKAEGRDPGLPSDVADLFPDSFEDSELGEIPKGWALRTLGSVCEQPQYGYTASASDEAIGPRFLRITDINKENWIKWDEVPFCSIEAAEQKKYALRPGDVIIARMADPGHGALIEDAVDAVFASYLIRFRPHERPFGRYLQYWLRSKMYWELVLSRQSGTTRANLNARVLSEFPLVVPDHLIRGAFAEEAEVLRSRVAANVRETAVLAAVRNALLPKLISGELRLKGAERSIGGKDT